MKRPQLENKESRRKLKHRHEPYWKPIHRGLHLGYRKGIWRVRVYNDGRYVWRSLGSADDWQQANGKDVFSYQQAQRRAIKLADSVSDGELVKRASGLYTVQDSIEDYLEWYELHRKAVGKTRAAAELHIIGSEAKHIRPSKIASRSLSDVTAREIRKWHESVASSPPRARSTTVVSRLRSVDASKPEENKRRRQATANRVLTILKASLNLAFREGHVDSDLEWRRVKAFRGTDSPKVRYLSEEECRRLVNSCPPDFRNLVHGAILSGCRYGELRRMKCSDFNPDSGTLHVRESKGGKPRHVPLTDEGASLMEELTAGRSGDAPLFSREDGSCWGETQQTRRMHGACTLAKLEPSVTFNELRHSYASLLVMRGASLEVIAEALGHSDTRMTKKHYAHLRPSYVSDTIRASLPQFSKPSKKISRFR